MATLEEDDMEAVTYRLLRNEPGKFEELLARQGTVILNKEGKPFALAVDIAEASLEDTVRLVTQIRAQIAISQMRLAARSRGLDRMTPSQIDKAIRSQRGKRRE
jgi:multidrug resistance efflux pump